MPGAALLFVLPLPVDQARKAAAEVEVGTATEALQTREWSCVCVCVWCQCIVALGGLGTLIGFACGYVHTTAGQGLWWGVLLHIARVWCWLRIVKLEAQGWQGCLQAVHHRHAQSKHVPALLAQLCCAICLCGHVGNKDRQAGRQFSIRCHCY